MTVEKVTDERTLQENTTSDKTNPIDKIMGAYSCTAIRSIAQNAVFQQAMCQYTDLQSIMDKLIAEQPDLESEEPVLHGLLEDACTMALEAIHAAIDAHTAWQAAALYRKMQVEKAPFLSRSQETQGDA